MIYRGYSIFRKSNGSFTEIKGEWSEIDGKYHGNLAHCGDRIFILLNIDDSQDEKVKTIIHELLHIGHEYGTKEWHIIPGFPPPYNLSEQEALKILGRLEERAEIETEKVLQCQPVLIEHFRKIINNLRHPNI